MTPAEEKALEILSTVCNVPREKLVPEARLIQDLDIDSVVTLDLLMELEESLGIDIPEVKAAEMQTVGDVLTYVRENPGE
ncbi:MAG: acyl carrier protein [Planctomycetes bacterium]|nr:acyl carrier protein [Planctomycetota bacterium]